MSVVAMDFVQSCVASRGVGTEPRAFRELPLRGLKHPATLSKNPALAVSRSRALVRASANDRRATTESGVSRAVDFLADAADLTAPPVRQEGAPVHDVKDSRGTRDTTGEGFNSALLLAGIPFLSGVDLEGPGSVLEAISVLALIVAVHEAGHFLAARSLGIHVTKFAIGFGPTIFKYQAEDTEPATPIPPPAPAAKGPFSWLPWRKAAGSGEKAPPPVPEKIPGVEYSLRLFPLGGYVAFPDEDENSPFAKDDPDLLKNRPLADRILVVSAGVIANLIFAFAILYTQVNTVGLLVQQFQPGVTVPKVISGGAGERGGLKDGDIILEVSGVQLPASEYSVSELVGIIKQRPNEAVELLVSRPNEGLKKLRLTPAEASDGSGRINVQLSPNVATSNLKARNPAEGAALTTSEMVRLGSLVTDGLRQLVNNFGEAAERLSGPVGIVAVGAEVARTNTAGLFQFAAIINLNLAIVNILPLPALDGGFLVLLLLEGLRGGKKLPMEVERAIMSSGLLLLLTAGVFLIVRDTINLAAFL